MAIFMAKSFIAEALGALKFSLLHLKNSPSLIQYDQTDVVYAVKECFCNFIHEPL